MIRLLERHQSPISTDGWHNTTNTKPPFCLLSSSIFILYVFFLAHKIYLVVEVNEWIMSCSIEPSPYTLRSATIEIKQLVRLISVCFYYCWHWHSWPPFVRQCRYIALCPQHDSIHHQLDSEQAQIEKKERKRKTNKCFGVRTFQRASASSLRCLPKRTDQSWAFFPKIIQIVNCLRHLFLWGFLFWSKSILICTRNRQVIMCKH